MDCLALLRVWWKAVFDGITLVFLLIIFVGLYVAQQIGSIVHRGFYCDDTSIRFPAKPSTVPTAALVTVGIFLNLLVMIGGNMWERFVSRKSKPGKPFHPCGGNFQSCLIPHWIVRICYELRWFLVGYVVTLVITDVGKVTVGRLRPNFIDVCNPDFSQFNCTDQFGNPLYVLDYVCRGVKHTVDASRVSWPSGHSSQSAYSFIFLTLYISSVRSFYARSAFKLMLMLFSFLLTMLIGLSRIADNKHHPTDVLSGWIIGAGVAFIIVYYNLKYFGELKSGKMSKDNPTNSEKLRNSTEHEQHESNTNSV